MISSSRILLHSPRTTARSFLEHGIRLRKNYSSFLPISRGLKTKIQDLRVRDVMKLGVPRSHWTVDETTTVFDATKSMVERDCGSLLVTRQGKIVGIITERDYLRKVIHCGRSSVTTKVSEICTSKLVVASLNDTMQDVIDAMATKEVRHLPVADPDANFDIVGLLSIRQVAKALALERNRAVKVLEDLEASTRMPIHDG